MSNITGRGADFSVECVGQICATRIVSTSILKRQILKLPYKTALRNFCIPKEYFQPEGFKNYLVNVPNLGLFTVVFYRYTNNNKNILNNFRHKQIGMVSNNSTGNNKTHRLFFFKNGS